MDSFTQDRLGNLFYKQFFIFTFQTLNNNETLETHTHTQNMSRQQVYNLPVLT